MQLNRTTLIAASLLMFVLLASTVVVADAQESQSRLANSNGNGTLKVGREEFKVTAVVVKLMDDHQAEITLVSDITVFLTGTWSASDNNAQAINLEITGGASGGGVEATGKLLLSENGKEVVTLDIKGANRISKRSIVLSFQGTK